VGIVLYLVIQAKVGIVQSLGTPGILRSLDTPDILPPLDIQD
jgi:hypothetical protein